MSENHVAFTKEIASFIANTKQESIPQDAYQHAKVAFMDWIAVTIGGKDDPAVEKLIKYADMMGGHDQATIIGHGIKKTVNQAALINGTASHVLDYDDTLVSFLGHPSVTLFPSLLALSEWKEKTGRQFLTAYLIGLQAGGTIGACASLDHYMAGWHATSTLGHFASAAGCSRLMKLDEHQTLHALGISGTQSCGLKRVFGTMCKPFHAGKSSEAGLLSAILASSGFTSAEDIIEGPQGFFQVLKGNVNPQILGFLGLGWDVVNLSQKYHASCHATHSPLEAVLQVIKDNHLSIDNIEQVKIFSSQLALDAAGKIFPSNGLEAKFSISYCVANAVIRGITGTMAFTDEMIADPAVIKLMQKIKVVLDPEIKALEARVEIQTADGQILSGFSDILQQIPGFDIKQKRVLAKFMDLCVPVWGHNRSIEISETILGMESLENMKTLVEMF